MDQVRDISPLRALRGLVSLDLLGTFPSRGKLSDLTPLRGMPLKRLNLGSSGVSDLGPLRGMPLTMLFLSETRVADLSPLKGARLELFTAERTPVSDLEPLRGMPLKYLDLNGAFAVSDLQAARWKWYMLRLEYLNVGNTHASDLSCIAGTKSLRTLVLDNGNVSDLSPIRGLDLTVPSIIGGPEHRPVPDSTNAPHKVTTDLPARVREVPPFARDPPGHQRPAVAEFWKGSQDGGIRAWRPRAWCRDPSASMRSCRKRHVSSSLVCRFQGHGPTACWMHRKFAQRSSRAVFALEAVCR